MEDVIEKMARAIMERSGLQLEIKHARQLAKAALEASGLVENNWTMEQVIASPRSKWVVTYSFDTKEEAEAMLNRDNALRAEVKELRDQLKQLLTKE